MPAADVTVSAEFEEKVIPAPKTLTLALTNPADIVKNIPETLSEVTVPLTITMEWDDDDLTESSEIEWTVNGADGATVETSDNKTATLKIPQTVTTPGEITVKAAVGEKESEPLAIRLDDKLVSKSGNTTKIYVANDSVIARGSILDKELKNGSQVKAEPKDNIASTELYMNGNTGMNDTVDSGYGAQALLTFDDTSNTIQNLLDSNKLYSATLVLTGAWSYGGGNQTRNFDIGVKSIQDWAAATTATTPIGADIATGDKALTYYADNSNTSVDLSAQQVKVDILALLKNSETRQNNMYYFKVAKNTKQAIECSLASRENENRGSYIELVEGKIVTFNATGLESVNATLIIEKDGQQIGTVEIKNGTGTIVLPVGTGYSYKMDSTGDYKEITSHSFEVVEDDSSNSQSVTFEANTANDATLYVEYTTDGSTKIDGTEEVEIYGAGDGKKEGMDITKAEIEAKIAKLVKVNSSDNLKYKAYTYSSGLNDTVQLSEGKNTIKLTYASVENGKEFYTYEDFENYAVETASGNVPGFSSVSNVLVKNTPTHGNVLWIRDTDHETSWTAKNWSTSAATPITADKVKLEYDIHYGYLDKDVRNITTSLKTSGEGDQPIVEITYAAGNNYVTGDGNGQKLMSVKIAGAEQLSAGLDTYKPTTDNQQRNYGGTTGNYVHVTVIVDRTNKMASVTLTKGETTNTYKASISSLTGSDIASLVVKNGVGDDNRCPALDNIKVYDTEETVTAD